MTLASPIQFHHHTATKLPQMAFISPPCSPPPPPPPHTAAAPRAVPTTPTPTSEHRTSAAAKVASNALQMAMGLKSTTTTTTTPPRRTLNTASPSTVGLSSVPRSLPSPPPVHFAAVKVGDSLQSTGSKHELVDDDEEQEPEYTFTPTPAPRMPAPVAGDKKRRWASADDAVQPEPPAAPKRRRIQSMPETPRRTHVGPPEIPQGLERSDFVGTTPPPPPPPAIRTPRREPWTADDDKLLVDWVLSVATLDDAQWAECARRLGNRSPDRLSSRWRGMINRQCVGVKKPLDTSRTPRHPRLRKKRHTPREETPYSYKP